MTIAAKAQIRKEIKEKLNKQSVAQRLHKSRLIKEKLFKLAAFKRAGCVMFYIATDKEVETRFMMAEAQKIGKTIAVPAILKGEKKQEKMVASLIEDLDRKLTLGPYGIPQPGRRYIRKIPVAQIDLVLLPGLAFDKKGNRLGRGKGYYDRFLAAVSRHIYCIGLAFDFQVLNHLPVLSHDIGVSKVISA
jgi:5-formyltetrahydrofolate cyclo-ligase